MAAIKLTAAQAMVRPQLRRARAVSVAAMTRRKPA